MGKYVKVTNHGNAFGTGDWLTFNCPSCGTGVYFDQANCKVCRTKLIHKQTAAQE